MKKNYLLIGLLLVTTTVVCGQTIYTVTSNADNGEGTLRDMISTASSGDSIVIQDDINEIVLTSEIRTENALRINGQGCTLKVTEPKVSVYRPLSFISSGEGIIINVALYNLTLIGGDISTVSTSSQERNGGALYVKRAALKLVNCTLTGKAYDGGGLSGENSTSLYIDGCIFDACVVTHNHAVAPIGGFSGEFTIKNSVFKDNDASAAGGCSGLDVSGSVTGIIDNCVFTGNVSLSGRGGAALSIRSLQAVLVENCLFEGNINNGSDGGTGITKQEGGSLTVTNCTFYDNSGGRGSYYHYAGTSVVVNSTFTGNTTKNTDSRYGGGFYAANAGTVTLVNNIFAYNYAGDVSFTSKDFYTTSVTPEGWNNIIVVGQNMGTQTNPVSYNEALQDLFATYTTNNNSKKIPELDAETGTVPLKAETSIAIGAGLDDHATITIPTTDQRGMTRAATPCIGSYEWKGNSTVINKGFVDEFKYWFSEGELIIIAEREQNVKLFGIDGCLLTRIQLHEGQNIISGLVKGLYLLNNQKIIVR